MREHEGSSVGVDLEHYFRLVMRQKWFLLSPIVLCVTLASIATMFMKNQYMARATILVEPQSIPTRFMSSALPYGPETYVRSLVEQIKSNSSLEKVIKQYNMFDGVRENGGMEEALNMMRKRIVIESKGRDTFSVAYTDSEPETSFQVANILTEMFIAENLNFRLERSRKNVDFLHEQSAKLRADVVAQEQQIQEFKSEHLDRLPEQRTATQEQLNAARERLFSLSESLTTSQAAASAAREKNAGSRRSGGGGGNSLALKLEKARSDLAALQGQYSERHPDVKLKQKEVNALERQVANQQTPAAKSGAKVKGHGASRAGEDLRVAEAEVGRIQTEMTRLEDAIKLYTERLEATPRVELELGKLTSGLEVLRGQADSYQEKATDAAVSLAMEEANQGSQFRAIDAATIPTRPVSPNRPLIIGMSAVLGVMLGLLLVFAMDVLFRTFLEEQDLAKFAGVPVLVSIPNVGPLPSEWQRFRGQVSNLIGYLWGSFQINRDEIPEDWEEPEEEALELGLDAMAPYAAEQVELLTRPLEHEAVGDASASPEEVGYYRISRSGGTRESLREEVAGRKSSPPRSGGRVLEFPETTAGRRHPRGSTGEQS